MRFCLILDLQDEPALIQEYLTYHRNVWPEIISSIRESGIRDMEIYHVEDRLVMMLDVEPGFSFEGKARMDSDNPSVQRWEELMSRFQKPLRNTSPKEKWRHAQSIFSLQTELSASSILAQNSRATSEVEGDPLLFIL